MDRTVFASNATFSYTVFHQLVVLHIAYTYDSLHFPYFCQIQSYVSNHLLLHNTPATKITINFTFFAYHSDRRLQNSNDTFPYDFSARHVCPYSSMQYHRFELHNSDRSDVQCDADFIEKLGMIITLKVHTSYLIIEGKGVSTTHSLFQVLKENLLETIYFVSSFISYCVIFCGSIVDNDNE